MQEPRVIVVVGSSTESWEDATRQIVRKVCASVPSVRSVDVVHQSARVADGAIVEYRVTAHVHFDAAGEDVGPREGE